MKSIRLDWENIHTVTVAKFSTIQQVLDQHASVFWDEIGTLRGTTAKIHIVSSARPRFLKAQQISDFLQAKVEKELQRLREGIVVPIQFSNWATPIIPIVNADDSIRLCGDHKVTVNQETRTDAYTLPHIEDFFGWGKCSQS